MSALISKPGITNASVLSIPTTWDGKWFRGFVNNQLKGADVRNATSPTGTIKIGGTLASPFGTLDLANPLNYNGIFSVNGSNGVANSPGGELVNGIASVVYSNAAVGAFSTVETYGTCFMPIPANALAVGSLFRINYIGVCSSTVGNNVTITPRYGPNGSTADTALSATVSVASTSGASSFWVQQTISCSAIGASGNLHNTSTILSPGNGISTIQGLQFVAVDTAGTTVDTTSAKKLGFSAKTSAGTTTLTIAYVWIERLY